MSVASRNEKRQGAHIHGQAADDLPPGLYFLESQFSVNRDYRVLADCIRCYYTYYLQIFSVTRILDDQAS
jgi:hypothetical protein